MLKFVIKFFIVYIGIRKASQHVGRVGIEMPK